MARDYKTRRGKATGFSGWVGGACGLALGLGVAAVVYIKDHRPDAPIARAGKADKRKFRGNELPETEAGDSAAEEPAKAYDFYDMLPKFEVMTGVPLAMDSATGSPNPSLNEGNSVQ